VDLSQWAAAQGGAFSRTQAMVLGLSSDAIQRRLSAGTWRAFGPIGGVYVHAAAVVTWETWTWAAVLGVGEPCAIGVSTAATLWGWRTAKSRGIELLVPPHRRPSSRSGLRIRRLRLVSSDLTRLGRLPITTRTRTLADCLRFLPLAEAVRVLDRAQQVSAVDVNRVLDRVPARGEGTAQARRLLSAAHGEHSVAERLATTLLRQAKVGGWRINHRVVLEGRVVIIDIAFVGVLVAVEIDGWAFHNDVDTFQRDRQRQNLLVRHGWRVLRFTYRDLVERPDVVLAQIVAATSTAAR
jgi:very-short-patch-repair endonuclease